MGTSISIRRTTTRERTSRPSAGHSNRWTARHDLAVHRDGGATPTCSIGSTRSDPAVMRSRIASVARQQWLPGTCFALRTPWHKSRRLRWSTSAFSITSLSAVRPYCHSQRKDCSNFREGATRALPLSLHPGAHGTIPRRVNSVGETLSSYRVYLAVKTPSWGTPAPLPLGKRARDPRRAVLGIPR